jgi:hypothetical protein
MKKSKTIHPDTLLADFAYSFTSLKRELEQLSYFCKGTVLKRMMKCGQQRCACHQDPAKRHGPYFEWTYKEKGKTVNRKLRPQEVPFFKAAILQHRKLQSILKRMEQVSRNAVVQLALSATLHRDP